MLCSMLAQSGFSKYLLNSFFFFKPRLSIPSNCHADDKLLFARSSATGKALCAPLCMYQYIESPGPAHEELLLLCLFCRCGHWDSEQLSHLARLSHG